MLYGVKDIGRNVLGMSSHSKNLRKDEFWALDDVSFEVKKGETLGIIGPNGSGKTTLLKLLNGTFWPDKGKITVQVRTTYYLLMRSLQPSLQQRRNSICHRQQIFPNIGRLTYHDVVVSLGGQSSVTVPVISTYSTPRFDALLYRRDQTCRRCIGYLY